MSTIASCILATFSTPERIGINSQSMLWLLPLVAVIAVVYKVTKIPHIRAGHFLKEAVILFGSIVVVMIIAALTLFALAWLVTE
jgi:hypothetical protein